MFRKYRVRSLKQFVIGIIVGMTIVRTLLFTYQSLKIGWADSDENIKLQVRGFSNDLNQINQNELYEESLADDLFERVKVLCWIMISPEFHHTRGVHIKNTWGRRCNKILFMSSIEDPELESIALPVKEKINHLWSKTKEAFKYISEHHLNDADWFLKADDDTYMVMENLRHMLFQYRPQTSLYFGQRLTSNETLDGFMQGGAYVLSKKAVQKFVKLYPNCRQKDAWAEDKFLGQCLTNQSIFVDTRDDLKQDRFLTNGVKMYFPSVVRPEDWFIEKSFYGVRLGTLSCCSEKVAGIHYVKNIREMYVLEYLIYHIDPYGVDKNSSETLPVKLSLQEILKAADVASESTLYVKHKVVHEMDSSEIF